MNLKRIKDSEQQIEVGNLNSYVKCLEQADPMEKSDLTTADFLSLEQTYEQGKRLTYKVTNKEDDEAVLSVQVSENSFINILTH